MNSNQIFIWKSKQFVFTVDQIKGEKRYDTLYWKTLHFY